MQKQIWLTRSFAVGLITLVGACTMGDGQPDHESYGSPGEDSMVEMAFPGAQGVVQTGLFDTPLGQLQLHYESFDGQAVYQGDIILPPPLESGERDFVAAGAGRSNRDFYWPNNTVFFEIAPNLPNQQRVLDAIAHWQARTPLRFVQATAGTAHRVRFVPGTGCSSHVGRQHLFLQPQPITLEPGCTTGNTIHEIGHAIGLWHEHTRADRDDHVIIHWENIASGREDIFRTYTQQGEDGYDDGPYDLTSVMHYGSTAFSINDAPTITRLDGSIFDAQREQLTIGDVAVASHMYPPPPQGVFPLTWAVPVLGLPLR